MKLIDGFKKLIKVRGTEVSAATQIPGPETPNVKPKQQVIPSFLRTARPDPRSTLLKTDRRLMNTDITQLRTGVDSWTVVRDFIKASPDLSAAVTAYIRVGITSGFTAVAKNLDGTFNPEATTTLAQVITRMNILNDYMLGFDDAPSLRACSETLALELLRTGSMAAELVLDKARLPDKIQPVAVSQVFFYPSTDGKKLRPVQRLGGDEIDLDIPTFFMTSLDQDPLEAYSTSPVESAIQGVIFSSEFINDVRRVVKRAIHPRMSVIIDSEKFQKMVPKDVLFDEKKLSEYMDRTIADVEEQVNNLQPEEAMILWDLFGLEVKDHGNTNLAKEYEVIDDLAKAKMAAGAKTLPTILGHSDGTSNVASAEVLLFMKFVEGSVWSKLNEMLSKIFTLAVRLLGHDVFVEFTYNTIELRPESELESFRQMRQSRILDQLSLGMITDNEACVRLTGQLPPAGYKPLSGTGFRPQTSSQPAGDGYNGASNSGSTMNQNLKPETPQKARGNPNKT